MENKRHDDKRYNRILKKQLETLREESNHLRDVVEVFFKNVEKELQELENKPRSSQVSFKKMSVTIQQAITHVVSNASYFTGDDDEVETDATITTSQGENTNAMQNVCSNEPGLQEQTDWKGYDSIKRKISLLEREYFSLKETIQDIQVKQENADVKLKDFSSQHHDLNQKLDMSQENNVNSKRRLQSNINQLSDKTTALSTSLQQLEENGNDRLDKLEKEIQIINGSKDVVNTHISSVRSCANDAVRSIEGLEK
ncbi:unnamed protein product, partial [Lymnaea stagnalis]